MRKKFIVFTMDDPLVTAFLIEQLIKTNHEIIKVYIMENPKLSLKRIVTIFITYGFDFYKFLLKFIFWNIFHNGKVLNILKKNKIDHQVLTKKDFFEIKKQISIIKPDFIFSIFCNLKIPNAILKLAKIKSINLHLGVLPKYRGLMPTFYSMLNSERYTGYCIHEMNDVFDGGPIICSRKIKINYKKNYYNNFYNLVKYAGEHMIQDLEVLINKKNSPIINNLDEGSYYSLPNLSEIKSYFVLRFKKILND